MLGYFFLNNLIGSGNLSFVGTYLNVNQVQKIKKYIFPYKLISQQKKELDIYKQLYPHFESELIFKASLENIKIEKIKDLKLSEDVILSKYIFNNGFYSGVAGKKPGGYLEFYDNNLFILSSRGILAFNDDLNKNLHFKQIENNINSFISLNQFNKDIWFSLKDLHIHDDRIYVSYTEEIREDCWNTSIISGEFNYEKIIFKNFFLLKTA